MLAIGIPVLCTLITAYTRLTHAHELHHRSIIDAPSLASSYDYIIAGGGNAGLVLASRLSEDSGTTVLVLEAGPTGDLVAPSIDIPGYNYYNSLWQSSYDWGYWTVPQKDLNNRTVYWPRGRVLGGSSATNALFYVRPSEIEINAWRDLITPQDSSAAKNWGWDSLFAAMKKSETFTPPNDDIASLGKIKFKKESHGDRGPIHTAYPPYMSSLMSLWLPSLEGAGIPSAEDSDGGVNLGGAVVPSTINPANWTRSYTVSAYINPLPPRSNLHILPNATVTRIVFDENSTPRKAIGVEWAVNKDSEKKVVNVNKEVLLSAGVVGTPQILMLSGVGPKDVLDSVGIKTQVVLPGVGQHVQEHLSAALSFNTTNQTMGDIYHNATQSDLAKSPEFLAFVNSGTAYINISTLFENSDTAKSWLDTAKSTSQQNFGSLVPSSDSSVQDGYKATTDATAKILGDGVGAVELIYGLMWEHSIQIQAASQHPFSRGRLYINTTSAFDKPIVDPGYFSHPADIIIARQAIKLLRRISSTEPLKSVLGNETAPGLEVQTDEQIDDWLRRTSASQFHPLGSCAMLPKNQGGVVDPSLRVYDLANVRIVDSSIYPLELSSHLAAPTYAMAEIGSEMLLPAGSKQKNASPQITVPSMMGYDLIP